MYQGHSSLPRYGNQNNGGTKRHNRERHDDYAEHRQQKQTKAYMRSRIERYRSVYDWEYEE